MRNGRRYHHVCMLFFFFLNKGNIEMTNSSINSVRCLYMYALLYICVGTGIVVFKYAFINDRI